MNQDTSHNSQSFMKTCMLSCIIFWLLYKAGLLIVWSLGAFDLSTKMSCLDTEFQVTKQELHMVSGGNGGGGGVSKLNSHFVVARKYNYQYH